MTQGDVAGARPTGPHYAKLVPPWGFVVRIIHAAAGEEWALVEDERGGRYHVHVDNVMPVSKNQLH